MCVCEDKNQPDVWGLGDRAPLLHCSSAAVTTYCGMGCMNGAVTPLLTQPAISTRAGSISFSCVVLLGWEQANEFRPFVRPSGPYHISMYVCVVAAVWHCPIFCICALKKKEVWVGLATCNQQRRWFDIEFRLQCSINGHSLQTSEWELNERVSAYMSGLHLAFADVWCFFMIGLPWCCPPLANVVVIVVLINCIIVVKLL